MDKTKKVEGVVLSCGARLSDASILRIVSALQRAYKVDHAVDSPEMREAAIELMDAYTYMLRPCAQRMARLAAAAEKQWR